MFINDESVIVTFPLANIAPPLPVAVLSSNMESLIVTVASLVAIAPPSLALLLTKFTLSNSTVIPFLWMYIAPPWLEAVFLVKLESLMLVAAALLMCIAPPSLAVFLVKLELVTVKALPLLTN